MATRLLSFENDISSFEIYFNLDRSAVSAREKEEIERAVNYIMGNNIAMINIEGHADRLGDDPHNNRLSKKRADKVIAYLKSRGIQHEMIVPSAYGEQFPRIATPDGMELRQNRRVLITWQDGF
jgi:outer membrane protein OmpA-like peptidoglycan-associated protein